MSKTVSKLGFEISNAHARLFDRCEKSEFQNGGCVKMSLLRDVIYKRMPNLQELLKQEKAKLNLKPLNKLTIRFDPFNNGVSDIRKFCNKLYDNDIIRTNPKCIIRTEILTDRSESQVIFDLTDGKQFVFKCNNLKCLEIFQLMNKYITPLAPKEELLSAPLKKLQKKK